MRGRNLFAGPLLAVDGAGAAIGPTSTLAERLHDQERKIIESALTESKGRIAGRFGAATKLGIPSSTLESKIRTLGIKKNHFRLDR